MSQTANQFSPKPLAGNIGKTLQDNISNMRGSHFNIGKLSIKES